MIKTFSSMQKWPLQDKHDAEDFVDGEIFGEQGIPFGAVEGWLLGDDHDDEESFHEEKSEQEELGYDDAHEDYSYPYKAH